MKRLLTVFAVVMIVATGVAFAAVLNTAHDLSGDTTSGETCIFCHTPHNATPAVPLWNNGLSSGSFDVYTSTTMDAASGDWTGGAGNSSDLCMSCHDGTDTMGDVGNPSDIGTITDPGAMSGANAIGTDLTNDHPVNIVYEEVADGELVAIGSLTLDLFAGNTVQCASCHDVHNEGTAVAGTAPFLAASNLNSDLCNDCHLK